MVNRYHVYWPDIIRWCSRIAWHAEGQQWEIKRILTVSRGGSIPATIVAHCLELAEIRHMHLTWHDDKPRLVVGDALPDSEWNSPSTLFVDDVYDTGRTVEFIKSVFKDVRVVTACTKVEDPPKVDYTPAFIPKSPWLIFPWEKGPNL
jgi:hypoxanthine phosphoribosyltransferase